MKRSSLGILILAFTLFSLISKSQTQITFYTNYGEFIVEMYDTITPITSGNFIDLVLDDYYDGVIFHRVIDDFMIQGGDPTGTGSGGPGYTIPDEFDSTLSNIQGTISMANAGPNTGGSQFFINLVNNTHLDFDKNPLSSAHPVFGHVESGFNIVDSIGNVQTGAGNRPVDSVIMDSLRLTHDPFGLNIEEVKSSQKPLHQLKVFPNPITPESVILAISNHNDDLKITILDPLGRIHNSKITPAFIGQQRIPLSDILDKKLSSGIYHIMISSKGQIDHIPIIIQ